MTIRAIVFLLADRPGSHASVSSAGACIPAPPTAAASSDALSSAMGEFFGSAERIHQSLAAAVSHSERYAPAISSTSSVPPRRGDTPPCLQNSAADRRGGAEPSQADA